MEKHFCPYGHDCPFNDNQSSSSGTRDDTTTGRPNGQVGNTIGTTADGESCTIGGDRYLGNSVGRIWDWNGKEIKTSEESFGWCGRNGTLSHGATTSGTSYNGTRSNSFSSSDSNKVTSTSDGMSKVESSKSVG